MEEDFVDFSELKIKAGRPVEDNVERMDLVPYLVEAQFKRKFKKFFSEWERFILVKAGSRRKYVNNMEEFYGEVIEKFSGLSTDVQRLILQSNTPIGELYNITNLSKPNLFHDKEDNDNFIKILETVKF